MNISEDLIKQISFKLRNPLSGILYHLDSVQSSGLSPEQLSSLTLAKDAFSQVLTSVSDLDDLLRLSKENFEAHDNKITMSELLESIKSVVLNGSGCEVFIVNVEDNVPAFIMGDESFVRQCLLYIINLAIAKSKIISLNVSCDQHPINRLFTISFNVSFPNTEEQLPRNDYGIFGLDKFHIDQIVSSLNANLNQSDSDIILSIPNVTSVTDSDLYISYSQLNTIVVSHNSQLTHSLQELFACFDNIYFCTTEQEMFDHIKQSYLDEQPTDLILVSQFLCNQSNSQVLQDALVKGDLYDTKIVCITDGSPYIEASLKLDKELHDLKVLNLFLEMFPECIRKEQPKELQQKPRVLVIDDDRVNNSILTKAFTTRHCLVSSCFSGHDAIDLLSKFSYDFIVLDYHLPNMTGKDLSKFIRECDQKMHQKSFIVGISADVNSDKIDSFRDDSTDMFIQKPVAANSIQHIVDRYYLAPTIRNVLDHPRILVLQSSSTVSTNLAHTLNEYFPNARVLTSTLNTQTCKTLGMFLPDLLISNENLASNGGHDIIESVISDNSFSHIKTLVIQEHSENILKSPLDTNIHQFLQSPYKPEELKQVILDLLTTSSSNNDKPNLEELIKKYNFPKEIFNSTRLALNVEDETCIKEILAGFQQSIQQRLIEYSEALSNRDIPKALDSLHSINGGAATIGAAQLKAIARTLEILVGSNQISRVDLLSPLLKESFRKTVEVYTNLDWNRAIKQIVDNH